METRCSRSCGRLFVGKTVLSINFQCFPQGDGGAEALMALKTRSLPDQIVTVVGFADLGPQKYLTRSVTCYA